MCYLGLPEVEVSVAEVYGLWLLLRIYERVILAGATGPREYPISKYHRNWPSPSPSNNHRTLLTYDGLSSYAPAPAPYAERQTDESHERMAPAPAPYAGLRTDGSYEPVMPPRSAPFSGLPFEYTPTTAPLTAPASLEAPDYSSRGGGFSERSPADEESSHAPETAPGPMTDAS